MKSIGDAIKLKDRDHRNSYEFQAYGNRLAEEFNDRKSRALYIKLAKKEDRNLLEAARLFVMGQEHITQKGRLFMWKFKQLKEQRKQKELKQQPK